MLITNQCQLRLGSPHIMSFMSLVFILPKMWLGQYEYQPRISSQQTTCNRKRLILKVYIGIQIIKLFFNWFLWGAFMLMLILTEQWFILPKREGTCQLGRHWCWIVVVFSSQRTIFNHGQCTGWFSSGLNICQLITKAQLMLGHWCCSCYGPRTLKVRTSREWYPVLDCISICGTYAANISVAPVPLSLWLDLYFTPARSHIFASIVQSVSFSHSTPYMPWWIRISRSVAIGLTYKISFSNATCGSLDKYCPKEPPHIFDRCLCFHTLEPPCFRFRGKLSLSLLIFPDGHFFILVEWARCQSHDHVGHTLQLEHLRLRSVMGSRDTIYMYIYSITIWMNAPVVQNSRRLCLYISDEMICKLWEM